MRARTLVANASPSPRGDTLSDRAKSTGCQTLIPSSVHF